MSKIEYDKIIALEPKYFDGIGDCTEIYYNDGEKIIEFKNIRSCMISMADYYCTNLKANRRVYGKELNIKNKVPYIFSDKHIMIQYKARIPMYKKDGANGYFDVNYFESFIKEEDEEFVMLKGGEKLKMKQKSETCKKYVNYAKLLGYKKR